MSQRTTTTSNTNVVWTAYPWNGPTSDKTPLFSDDHARSKSVQVSTKTIQQPVSSTDVLFVTSITDDVLFVNSMTSMSMVSDW